MARSNLKNQAIKTWGWIIGMVAIIFAVGLLTFFTVSNKGEPTWDYRPVKSLPASSPYATYQRLPFPQHVHGRGGK